MLQHRWTLKTLRLKIKQNKTQARDFPGGPGNTLCSHCKGHRFSPWSGTKIPNPVWRAPPPQKKTPNNKQKTLRLSEKDSPKRSYSVWFYWYEVSRIGRFIETESSLAVARGWGEEGIRSICQWVQGFILGCWECSGIRQGGWLHNNVTVLQPTGKWSSRHVNYT